MVPQARPGSGRVAAEEAQPATLGGACSLPAELPAAVLGACVPSRLRGRPRPGLPINSRQKGQALERRPPRTWMDNQSVSRSAETWAPRGPGALPLPLGEQKLGGRPQAHRADGVLPRGLSSAASTAPAPQAHRSRTAGLATSRGLVPSKKTDKISPSCAVCESRRIAWSLLCGHTHLTSGTVSASQTHSVHSPPGHRVCQRPPLLPPRTEGLEGKGPQPGALGCHSREGPCHCRTRRASGSSAPSPASPRV